MTYTDGFLKFWEAYPRKVGKASASKAWDKTGADEDLYLLKAIIADVEKRDRIGWFENLAVDKIPHPASYLNAHRWEDEDIEGEIGSKSKKRKTARKPEPPITRPPDEWWDPCCRLWFMYALQAVLADGRRITEPMANECRSRAKAISERYREDSGGKDLPKKEYGDILTLMGSDLISSWNQITKAPEGAFSSLADMKSARASHVARGRSVWARP